MAARSNAGWILGGALALLGVPSVARADNSVSAQALFDEAKKAAAAQDFASACPKFEASLRLDFGLGTLLNLADCNERQGKLATAWAQFLELAGKARAAGQTERFRLGKQRAAALAHRLSTLVIRAAGSTSGLEVLRDGSTVAESELGVAIPADPGRHTIEAKATGKRPWSTSVAVGEGATTSTVTVPELEPLPPAPAPAAAPVPALPGPALQAGSAPSTGKETAPSNAQKVVAVVSLGVAAVGAGLGAYFGLQSLSDHNRAASLCPATRCPATPDGTTGLGLWSDAHAAGDRATIALAIGGVALAGGIVLWWTAPSSRAAGSQVGLGPGTIQIRGAW